MNRDELEAVIWRWLRYIGEDRHGAAPAVVDAILDAADKYSTYTGGITAARRAVIGGALPETDLPETGAEKRTINERRAAIAAIHWTTGDGHAACGNPAAALVTTIFSGVTCRPCRRTHAYRGELAIASTR